MRYLKPIAVVYMIFQMHSVSADFRVPVGIEWRYFPEDSTTDSIGNLGLSLTIQPEYRRKFMDDRSVFNATLFFREDGMDDKRTHADIRQLDVIISQGDWEYQAGISKVFWGVTESEHLTDIINQTDNVENIDGEEKLGQPMLRATRFYDGGSLSLYILPYFRERVFASEEGRLRSGLPVSNENIDFESSDKERHIDYAVRVQHSFTNVDIGLYYFNGTSREPVLVPNLAEGVLDQYYPLIEQIGLDLQYTKGDWLWKLESIDRHAKSEDYLAAVGGFEYTQPRAFGSRADLGLIAEYLYDSRGEDVSVAYQNDLFLGVRMEVNDLDSTSYLIGGYFDLDNRTTSYRIERTSRISNSISIEMEAQIFTNVATEDPCYDLRRDSYFQLVLRKYF